MSFWNALLCIKLNIVLIFLRTNGFRSSKYVCRCAVLQLFKLIKKDIFLYLCAQFKQKKKFKTFIAFFYFLAKFVFRFCLNKSVQEFLKFLVNICARWPYIPLENKINCCCWTSFVSSWYAGAHHDLLVWNSKQKTKTLIFCRCILLGDISKKYSSFLI